MSETPTRAHYRILDASANRAGEGLRTLEEFARFRLDHGDLTERLKVLRHNLASAMELIPRGELLQARDTAGDVGTEITVGSERQRSSTEHVVAAAAARTQQALRCLEEYGKTEHQSFAAKIEQIRYRSYTLFADLEIQEIIHAKCRRISAASTYVLIGADSTDEALAQTVRSLADAGAEVLQLRDSTCDDRTLFERACVGAEAARESGLIFLVNDRPDIAAAADADGVHVGQNELPVSAARQIVGHDRLVGVSTHTIDQAHQAVADGADYIGCGPVFPGRTKAFDHYAGPAFLKEVAGQIDLPAFAIGGIDTTNVSQVAVAGFKRVAVTAAVRDAKDPAEVIESLKRALQ